MIDRLDAERRSVDYDEGDEFWVCLDADHWMEPSHIGNLREVIRLCNQKQYRLAICNPCFELWLLLHFEDHTGQESRNCASVVEALRIVANGYQKGAVTRWPITAELVHLARERARRLDNDNRDPPTGPAARIHRILDSLLERDSIDLKS